MNEVSADQPEIERHLAQWKSTLGKDYAAYRGHVCRVVHYCRALVREPAPDDAAKIAIAATFHDLGVWTHHTMDYLAPSVELASRHLEEIGRQSWVTEISEMILNHHKLLPYRAAEGARLVEPFRRADLVDLTSGRIRFGLEEAFVREVKQALPARGFYRRLLWLLLGWAVRHPLRPLPMVKR